ncbi:MAG: TlyA family RNA methyltransferase [Candidatus Nanopelagicaceae bacterium]
MRIRLDQEMVRRHLVRSREEARSLIESGHLRVNGITVRKPASRVAENDSLTVDEEVLRYASRGGLKLRGALDDLPEIKPLDKRVIDAGASTGGFTDVLLQSGARIVYAVDVGYGQLDWRLQNHPQVKVIDRKNVKDLKVDEIENRVDLLVSDLSFISLKSVLPTFVDLVDDAGEMLLLVKPQFEVGRERLPKGGVLRDPSLRAETVREVAQRAWGLGWGVAGVVASRHPGPAGNVEYFLWLRRGAPELRESDLAAAIEKGPS